MSSADQQIREFISAELANGSAVQLTNDTRLIESEIIDSLGIFLLVNFLQERFAIQIEPEDVTLDNFHTVSAMTRLVNLKQGLLS